MAALYELVDQIQNFDLQVDEETGEILNIMQLDELVMEKDEKVENIALWIKNLTAEAKAIKEEAEKLRKRAQAAGNKADRLKEYLQMCLAGEKFKTARVAISYRKSKAVNVTDITEIPEEYTSFEIKADKAEIKKALEMGVVIPGAELEERESMTIR